MSLKNNRQSATPQTYPGTYPGPPYKEGRPYEEGSPYKGGDNQQFVRQLAIGNRVGIGYDIHRLVENRKLILGGVEIPFRLGLLGHSDADVLLHAICDAILGAAAMGDIGKHFPDTDPKYSGISSLILLERVNELVEENYSIGNIDSVVIAEQPKLASFIPEMRSNIASVLKIERTQVSIKATTHEGLGDIGKCKAIAAKAVVILRPKGNEENH